MKKVLAVIALSAFLFSCGGSSDSNSTDQSTEQVAPAQDSSAATAPAATDSAAAPAAPAPADSSAAPAASNN